MTDDARTKSGLATVAEVAAELRIGRASVYRLIHSGALTTLRVGRAYRVPEADLAAFKKRAVMPASNES